MMKKIRLALPILILIILLMLSLFVGSYRISFGELVRILTFRGNHEGMEYRVFMTLRLPRTLMACCAGLVLGTVGAVYQTVFRNPLASPDITGVASGASLGAALAIVTGFGGIMGIMGGAFVFGMLALLFVVILAGISGRERLGSYILAGIIVSAAAEAGLMLLKDMADPEKELSAIEYWLMGSLSNITADKLYTVLPITLAVVIFLICVSKQILLLAFPDNQAMSTGLNPGKWRILILTAATFGVASVIAVTGVISFVGLIAPHIAGLYLGKNGRTFLIYSGIFGASVTMLADILTRAVGSGAELPLSVWSIVISLPFIVILMLRRRR